MNVTELAEQIATKHGVERKQAKQVIDGVFKAVIEAAQKGEEVSIPGFGKFKVSSREARQGRNPATGETIQIAASKKLAFTPAKQVRDAMNPDEAAGGGASAGGKAASGGKSRK
jgi:DNA-binding protein HU-beta